MRPRAGTAIGWKSAEEPAGPATANSARRRSVRKARLARFLFRFRFEVWIALHEADAGVPAQDGVVVSGGAGSHRLRVPVHRLEEEAGGEAGVRSPPQLPLAPPLGNHPGVVGPVVLPAQLRQCPVRMACAHVGVLAELVGDGEEQHHQHLLVVGVDLEDVEADALRLLRLVEQPVALRFGNGPGNARAGDRLELEHDALLFPHLLPRKSRNSFRSGSYIPSTTLSLRGMMALSVMLISSGQTRVQHLVMLQKPTPWVSFSSASRSSVSSGCISSAAT